MEACKALKNGSAKFSVDAFFRGSNQEATVGGLLWDLNNRLLCIFSTSIHASSVLGTKLLAIKEALKIMQEGKIIVKHGLIIEGDSLMTINGLN